MPKLESDVPSNTDMRAWFGTILVGFSVITIAVVAIAMVNSSSHISTDETKNAASVLATSKELLSSLLPMFGTWIGTVLAFYFTRENFESANRATAELVRSATRPLQSTRVMDVVIERGDIFALKVKDEAEMKALKVDKVETAFTHEIDGQRINRLPIFDDGGVCLGLVHRSIWQEMLLTGYRATPQVDQTKPLSDFLALVPTSATGTFGTIVTGSVAFIARDRTLADAKAAMEALPGCQDIMVTETGKRGERVVGWLTNVKITAVSRA